MSDSDDEYDPAEVVVSAPAPASDATTAANTGAGASRGVTTAPGQASATPLSRADIFSTSTPSGHNNAGPSPLAASNSAAATLHDTHAPEGGYRLRSDIKGRIRCLALNPAGTTLCAGSEDGQLCMWDFNVPLKTHRVAPTRVLTPFVNRIAGLQPIIALTSAKDGSYFVACQDGDSPALVRASGEQLGYCAMGERGLLDVVQCRGHRAPVTSVAAHHRDAATFLTGSQDGTARLWNSTTFKQRSVYAVKHGSGQVTDTVVVESVATLRGYGGGSGGGHANTADVFASGGQDGVVQLWDSRVKYRPGGSLASVDVLTPAATAEDDTFLEKHVGGLLEVATAASGPSDVGGASASHATASAAVTPSSLEYSLAVRVGSVVKMIDLRQLSSAAHATSSAVVQEAAAGLPFVLDTTCLTAGSSHPAGSTMPSSLLTCTSRAGYEKATGGHVVQYGYRSSLLCGLDSTTHAFQHGPLERWMTWRAGRPDEDVLCVCADRSRVDGCIYAGLSSGEVVVHGAFSAGTNPQPLETWLQTRPEREGRGRVPGEKAGRGYDDADLMATLF